MKINVNVVSPELTLEPLELQDYILDRDEKASGLSTPFFEKEETEDGILIRVKENKGEIYYYGLVATQYNAQVSPMEIITSTIKQEEESISHVIHQTNQIPLRSFSKETFLKKDEVCQDGVPHIADHDIECDLRNIIISNDVIINLPNIWYDVNKVYNYRSCFDLYLTAISGQASSEQIKLFSNEEKIYIPLEKIEILRKDISLEPYSEEPDNATDASVETVKVFVLKDGGYYEKGYEKYPLNIITKDELLSVFDYSSTRKTLSFSNKIEHEKIYRYTIRVFDRFKKSSRASVVILRT